MHIFHLNDAPVCIFILGFSLKNVKLKEEKFHLERKMGDMERKFEKTKKQANTGYLRPPSRKASIATHQNPNQPLQDGLPDGSEMPMNLENLAQPMAESTLDPTDEPLQKPGLRRQMQLQFPSVQYGDAGNAMEMNALNLGNLGNTDYLQGQYHLSNMPNAPNVLHIISQPHAQVMRSGAQGGATAGGEDFTSADTSRLRGVQQTHLPEQHPLALNIAGAFDPSLPGLPTQHPHSRGSIDINATHPVSLSSICRFLQIFPTGL